MDEDRVLLPKLQGAIEEMKALARIAAQSPAEHEFSNPQVGPAPEPVTDQLHQQYNHKLTNIVCRMKDVAMGAGLELNLVVGLVEFLRGNGLQIGSDIEQDIKDMLDELTRVDNGSEHGHSGYNANGYEDRYSSEADEEVEPFDDDDDDDIDDDRTESTALATLDDNGHDWRGSTSSHQQRVPPRRLSAIDGDFAADDHLLGHDSDIEEGQRSEQEDEIDEDLRAAAEAVRHVEYEPDTWLDDDDAGWVSRQISIEEFQEQELDAVQRMSLSREFEQRVRQWQAEAEAHEERLQRLRDQSLLAGQANPGLRLQEEGSQHGDEDEPFGDEYAEDREDGEDGEEDYEGMDDDLEAAEAQLSQLPGAARDRSSVVRLNVPDTQSVGSQISEDRERILDMFDQQAVWPEHRSQRDSIRPADIQGQLRMRGVQGEQLGVLKLRVIFEPHRTGFEESKDFNPPLGSIIAGKYKVSSYLGQAAFSTALHCVDMKSGDEVCLKMIKNNKDYFDQSIDEIKLLQYINTRGDPDEHHVLRLYDFFYHKEHLFIVSELLRENLYDFQRFLMESGQPSYFTIPRLKKIMVQVLEALHFVHGLNLIHCDVKPENIVIKSYSRCEVKLIDFGSSCYTHDHATTYIQSRSYRAPEVILGLAYDQKIDIWSLGAVLAELYTGYVLFQNDSIQTMLARIAGIVGPFPDHMLFAGTEAHRFFTSSGIVYEALEDGSGANLIYPKPTTLRHRLHTDDEEFLDFTQRMLSIDPLHRPTAWEALQHPFLENINDDEVLYQPSA